MILGTSFRLADCARAAAMQSLPKRQKRMIEVRDSPKLSDEEHHIFKLLLDVSKHFNLETQLRVAGGWVRDKLLGKDCSDIDIALDNMVGQEFCEKVNEYLKIIGEDTRNIGVIPSRPEQSKHLETATMRIRGVFIDFVNLRAETYADKSRIPKMKFGTPKQDAERRDLTINSLFYNINTGEVEDYTERGIKDLTSGIIATPLEPKVTFLDDPLRVLRSVRFGARFGFELNQDLKEAAASEEVKTAFSTKNITRERIGHEIELMLLGHGTITAMRLLAELELFSVVFTPPSSLQNPLQDDWGRMCVEYIEAGLEVLNGFGVNKLTKEQKRIFLLSALFYPLKDSSYTTDKRKVFPVTSYIIKESLKLKNNDRDGVEALHKTSKLFLEMADVLLRAEGSPVSVAADSWEGFQRIKSGSLLPEVKELWRAALVLSSLEEYTSSNGNWDPVDKASACIAVEETIIKQGLERAWELKPLLDGTVIIDDLNIHTGGPVIKKWKDLAVQWQLAHPSGSAAACREWLKQEHSKA